MNAIDTLMSISSDAIIAPIDSQDVQLLSKYGRLGYELRDLLLRKNGFFALESSLHVFPVGENRAHITLELWNSPELWRGEFGSLLPPHLLFFAEDAFGNQYGLDRDTVVMFYGETAELEPLCDSIEKWVDTAISEWRSDIGYQLAHEWQTINRPLAEHERLIPKLPFVLGGRYEVSNLYAGACVHAMRFRASLASQIANMPDGTSFKLRIE